MWGIGWLLLGVFWLWVAGLLIAIVEKATKAFKAAFRDEFRNGMAKARQDRAVRQAARRINGEGQ